MPILERTRDRLARQVDRADDCSVGKARQWHSRSFECIGYQGKAATGLVRDAVGFRFGFSF